MDHEQFAELNFEQAMTKLEQIVEQLDHGEVPLEQAIELFQQGMQLSKLCGQKLDTVEKKIEVLIEQNGEWTSNVIDPPTDEQGDLF